MPGQVRFGPFAFDPTSGALTKHGAAVRLQPQPARLLAVLVGRPGEVVSRDELRQQVWGEGTYVDFERGLNFAIAHIRAVLGDSADRPLYIETLPRRGYRFIAPVRAAEPDAVVAARDAAPAAADAFPADATAAAPAARATALARSRLAVAGAATVAMVALAGGAMWVARPAAGPVRVAVVPFDNETGQDALDEVAVAIADQTVARLATDERLPRLRVIGNAATLRRPRSFRDIKAIGDAAQVQYVLLAQMKTDATAVRLIAHLIRVEDETHVWANSFDRPAFTLQTQAEIAESIAAAVTARLADP